MKKKRETPKQKARALAKAAGLKFWLCRGSDGYWTVFAEASRPYVGSSWWANLEEVALWRALARERGVRLG